MSAVIQFKNIAFTYTQDMPLFSAFSLTIEQAHITILRGENGSGKTTLTRLAMGMLKPLKGSIFLLGNDIASMQLGEIGQKVGYAFQSPEKQLFAATVYEEMTFPRLLLGHPEQEVFDRADQLLKQFDLQAYKEMYPRLLSFGEKRRLAIAAMLMNNPSYLILDEPTASLDDERVEVLSAVIEQQKKEKRGMLIVSHNEAFIRRHGDRIITLERGHVIDDSYR
jgi:energy-coupling factor transport system ATP-binding protein